MLIGDLATHTGISRDTIRYYEKLGLIKLNKKDRRDNNYKEYSAQVLERLSLIKRLKFLGFTLNEIGEIINLYLGDTNPCEEILGTVKSRIEQIDQKMKELEQFKARLSAVRDNCNGNCQMDDIVPVCLGCN